MNSPHLYSHPQSPYLDAKDNLLTNLEDNFPNPTQFHSYKNDSKLLENNLIYSLELLYNINDISNKFSQGKGPHLLATDYHKFEINRKRYELELNYHKSNLLSTDDEWVYSDYSLILSPFLNNPKEDFHKYIKGKQIFLKQLTYLKQAHITSRHLKKNKDNFSKLNILKQQYFQKHNNSMITHSPNISKISHHSNGMFNENFDLINTSKDFKYSSDSLNGDQLVVDLIRSTLYQEGLLSCQKDTESYSNCHSETYNFLEKSTGLPMQDHQMHRSIKILFDSQSQSYVVISMKDDYEIRKNFYISDQDPSIAENNAKQFFDSLTNNFSDLIKYENENLSSFESFLKSRPRHISDPSNYTDKSQSISPADKFTSVYSHKHYNTNKAPSEHLKKVNEKSSTKFSSKKSMKGNYNHKIGESENYINTNLRTRYNNSVYKNNNGDLQSDSSKFTITYRPPGGVYNISMDRTIHYDAQPYTGRMEKLKNKAMEFPFFLGVSFEDNNFAWVARMKNEVRRFLVKKYGWEKSHNCAVDHITNWRNSLPTHEYNLIIEEENRKIKEILRSDPNHSAANLPATGISHSSFKNSNQVSQDETVHIKTQETTHVPQSYSQSTFTGA